MPRYTIYTIYRDYVNNINNMQSIQNKAEISTALLITGVVYRGIYFPGGKQGYIILYFSLVIYRDMYNNIYAPAGILGMLQ